MGIFNFFRSRRNQNSAGIAKERLQVVIAHERSDREGPDYLPKLKRDILDVIKKYVEIGDDQVSVQLDSQDNCDVLELNITLPDDLVEQRSKQSSKKSKAAARRAKSGTKKRITKNADIKLGKTDDKITED